MSSDADCKEEGEDNKSVQTNSNKGKLTRNKILKNDLTLDPMSSSSTDVTQKSSCEIGSFLFSPWSRSGLSSPDDGLATTDGLGRDRRTDAVARVVARGPNFTPVTNKIQNAFAAAAESATATLTD